ncbi:MAG: chloride channel protein [Salibacteraceae bacterium]
MRNGIPPNRQPSSFRRFSTQLWELIRLLLKPRTHRLLFKRFMRWQQKNLRDQQFIYLLAVVIGFLSGVVAAVLKKVVSLVELLLAFIDKTVVDDYHNYLYFAYPLLGILITLWLIKRVVRYEVAPGIPNVLFALSKRNGRIRRHNLYSSILTSAFTVGFGGSVGLEGPTVGTTSAVGSYFGSRFRLTYQTRMLLIGCAASGALASLFKAPIAAIVFAVEVIMIDLTTASMIPLLMASAAAALTSQFLLGDALLLHFPVREDFLYSDLPFFAGLGICCGLLSTFFTKAFFRFLSWFEKLQHQLGRTMVAGLLLGGLIFLLPPLYGEGYATINLLISNQSGVLLENSLFADYQDSFAVILLFLLGLVLLKGVATILTIRAGGVGGIFAPALFMGSTLGFFFASLFRYFGIAKLSVSNFTLVGMGGVMAGILHAPLTAIFLIAEITGGYELFIPLMITASIAYITVRYTVPHSIYTLQLARRGALITHDKDTAVLTLMKLKNEIETNFLPIGPYDSLGDLVAIVARSDRNLFPVLDEQNNFLGVVQLNDIREIMFDRDQYDQVQVHELMKDAPEFIQSNENMDSVMKKFENSGAWNLPVLEGSQYLGFVSKSKLFSAYRQLLRDFYQEPRG